MEACIMISEINQILTCVEITATRDMKIDMDCTVAAMIIFIEYSNLVKEYKS